MKRGLLRKPSSGCPLLACIASILALSMGGKRTANSNGVDMAGGDYSFPHTWNKDKLVKAKPRTVDHLRTAWSLLGCETDALEGLKTLTEGVMLYEIQVHALLLEVVERCPVGDGQKA